MTTRTKWWLSHTIAYILGAWGGGWSVYAVHAKRWGLFALVLVAMILAVSLDYMLDEDRKRDDERAGSIRAEQEE